jgi:hypothetical protein
LTNQVATRDPAYEPRHLIASVALNVMARALEHPATRATVVARYGPGVPDRITRLAAYHHPTSNTTARTEQNTARTTREPTRPHSTRHSANQARHPTA